MTAFHKAIVGEPRKPLTACEQNALVDALNRDRLGQFGQRQGTAHFPRATTLIRVLNRSDRDLERFHVVELVEPVLAPPDSEEAFLDEPCFAIRVPEKDDATNARLAILLEPLEQAGTSASLARAVVAGCTQARIDVQAEDDTACNLHANSTRLRTSGSGPVQILWKEPGLGEKWAYVRVGGSPGNPPELWAFNAPLIYPGEDQVPYAFASKLEFSDDSDADTDLLRLEPGETNRKVYLPLADRGEDGFYTGWPISLVGLWAWCVERAGFVLCQERFLLGHSTLGGNLGLGGSTTVVAGPKVHDVLLSAADSLLTAGTGVVFGLVLTEEGPRNVVIASQCADAGVPQE